MNKIATILLSLILAIVVGLGGCTTSSPGSSAGRQDQGIVQPPNSPSNLIGDSASPTIINLRWLDNSNNEDGFRIYRDNQLIQTVPSNVTTYQDTGLKPATVYQYIVRAYNATGESASCTTTTRMPNPPIRVRLDRVGVADNGEEFLRDLDGGEVFLGIIITDGKVIVKKQLPQQGQYYHLSDNEIVDVGMTIFSVDEVGDYLRVAAVGYEADGGQGEQLIYQALGMATDYYLSGGAATLLEIPGYSTGNIIAKLFGADDDWLGSYEKAWNSSSNWGVGKYTDIACHTKSGAVGLRLWFTIESPGVASASSSSSQSQSLPARQSFNLAPSGSGAYYTTMPFSLQAYQTLYLTLRCDRPIYIMGREIGSDGLLVSIIRVTGGGGAEFNAEWIKSSEVQGSGSTWEAKVTISPGIAGIYELDLLNMSSDRRAQGEYIISVEGD